MLKAAFKAGNGFVVIALQFDIFAPIPLCCFSVGLHQN